MPELELSISSGGREISIDEALVDSDAQRSDSILSQRKSSNLRSGSIFSQRSDSQCLSGEGGGNPGEALQDLVPKQEVSDKELHETVVWSRGWMRFTYGLLYGIYNFGHKVDKSHRDDREKVKVFPWVFRITFSLLFVHVVAMIYTIAIRPLVDQYDEGLEFRAFSLPFVGDVPEAIFLIYAHYFAFDMADSRFIEKLEDACIVCIKCNAVKQSYLRGIGVIHCASACLFVVSAIYLVSILLTIYSGFYLTLQYIWFVPPFLCWFVCPMTIIFHQSMTYIWFVLCRYKVTEWLVANTRAKLANGGEAPDVNLIRDVFHDHFDDVEGLSESWSTMNVARLLLMMSRLASLVIFNDVLYANDRAWYIFTLGFIITYSSVWASVIAAGIANKRFYDNLLYRFFLNRRIHEESELGKLLRRLMLGKDVIGYTISGVFITTERALLIGSTALMVAQALIWLMKYLHM